MKNSVYIILLVLLFGCDRKVPVSQEDKRYTPIELNTYKIYRIDSIIYQRFNNSRDSVSLFRREFVDEQFVDNEGDASFRIEVSVKYDSAAEWKFSHFYAVKCTDYTMEINEHNMRMVKLVFPIVEFKSWDENEMSVAERELNRYQEVGGPFQLDQKSYSNTVSVDGGLVDDIVLLEERKAVYAWDIGLVYEIDKHIETQNNEKEGYELYKTLLDYGP